MAYQLNINWPEFLEKYWQKQLMVLKNAFPDFVDPITPDELAGLAMEPEVDSCTGQPEKRQMAGQQWSF